MEKIKVNISNSVYAILKKDMELFEFYKPDGSLNQNLFYTTVIMNYYSTFSSNQQQQIAFIKHNINKAININQDTLNDLSYQIFNYYNKKNYDELDNFDKSISIKPTKISIKIITYIEEYLLDNSSISNYYRLLFTSYSNMPQNQREKIVFKEQYDTILKAIKENHKIFFTTTSSKINHEASPYKIVSSKEELFNYVLAIYKNSTYTYRLTRIKDVTILDKNCQITESQINLFERMISCGPQYNFGIDENEDIIVSLSEYGKSRFKSNYIHRPAPYKIENDLYYFNCTQTQILNYFSRFGGLAKIISPIKLAENMKKFHQIAYLSYRDDIE